VQYKPQSGQFLVTEKSARHNITLGVQTVSASRPRLRLRSSSSTDYVLPRLCTKFGERAFSHTGPSAWNRLPEDIRAEPDITNCRKLLKTHYFNSAFNVQ